MRNAREERRGESIMARRREACCANLESNNPVYVLMVLIIRLFLCWQVSSIFTKLLRYKNKTGTFLLEMRKMFTGLVILIRSGSRHTLDVTLKWPLKMLSSAINSTGRNEIGQKFHLSMRFSVKIFKTDSAKMLRIKGCIS